jgi:prevent-host-death family protein
VTVLKVGIRELKNRASEIIRAVRERGAQYIVTRRGHPVGLLLPIDETSLEAAVRHVVTGEAKMPTKGPPPLTPEEVLHLARQVYADLSSEKIETVEAIVLDRSHFSPPEP